MARERRNRGADGGFDAGHHLERFTAAVLTVFSWISSQNYTGSILAEGLEARCQGSTCRRRVGPSPALVTLTYHRLGVAVETICAAVARIGSGRPTASFTRSCALSSCGRRPNLDRRQCRRWRLPTGSLVRIFLPAAADASPELIDAASSAVLSATLARRAANSATTRRLGRFRWWRTPSAGRKRRGQGGFCGIAVREFCHPRRKCRLHDKGIGALQGILGPKGAPASSWTSWSRRLTPHE
jgi:hypothetical protein